MGERSRAIYPTTYEIKVFWMDGDFRCYAGTADHFDIAKAGFEAAKQCYTGARIMLMNGARTIDEALTGLYDSATGKVAAEPTTNDQIHNRLYEAMELIGTPLDLLQIVGSWGDTMPEAETLAQLDAFIAKRQEHQSLSSLNQQNWPK